VSPSSAGPSPRSATTTSVSAHARSTPVLDSLSLLKTVHMLDISRRILSGTRAVLMVPSTDARAGQASHPPPAAPRFPPHRLVDPSGSCATHVESAPPPSNSLRPYPGGYTAWHLR